MKNSASTTALFKYVTLTRRVFTARTDDRSAWADITQMLYHLREALTCVVCASIAQIPHCPANSRCSHHVCRDCRGMPTMRPHCTVCKEAAINKCFKQNTQVEYLINCFEKLCKFLVSSQALENWGSLSTHTLYGETITFGQLVREGSSFNNGYTTTGSSSNNVNSNQNGSLQQNIPSSQSTIISSPSSVASSSTQENLSEVFKKKAPVKEKEHHCRCGSGAQKRDGKAGNLTCRGQRCACYRDGRNCSNCRCAGCMNPNGTPIATSDQATKH